MLVGAMKVGEPARLAHIKCRKQIYGAPRTIEATGPCTAKLLAFGVEQAKELQYF
jgi:hypothetical protein